MSRTLEEQLAINDLVARNMAAYLETASAVKIDDFVNNGPFEKDKDSACRYLMAIALRYVSVSEFMALTGVSEDAAAKLLAWLEESRVTFGIECPR